MSLLQKIAFLRRACAPLDERNEHAIEKHDAEIADSGRTRAVASSSSTTAAPLSAPPSSTSAYDADQRDDDDDDDDCVIVTQRRRGVPAASAPPASRDARGDAGSDDESSVPLGSVRAAATDAGAAAARFVAPPSAVPQLPAAHEVGPITSLEPLHAGLGAAATAAASMSSRTALVDGYTCYVDGLATLPGGFGLPRKLFERLYSYQRAGIAWMWSLHADAGSGGSGGGGGGDKVCGGILADDMGLGAFPAAIRRVALGLVA